MISDVFWQVIGLVILVGSVGFGYWRWVRPYATKVTAWGMGLLTLILLIGVGGLLGSPFWWLDVPQSFSWDLPPLAGRLLGSAGVAFAVGTYLCLQRPVYKRVRLILLLTAVYLLPLVLAILIFHLDRFDFAAPITYGFFILAAGIGIAVTVYLIRQPVLIADAPRDKALASGLITAWLVLVGLLSGGWGLALFATDAGPSTLIWVWPGDLLTSRLIAVMLLAIATVAFYSARNQEAARLLLVILVVYGMGVVLAVLWNPAAIKPLYVALFAILSGVSSGLLLTNRKMAG
jgi:hypothetical protein